MWWYFRKFLFLFDPEWIHEVAGLSLQVYGFFKRGRTKPVRWKKQAAPEFAGFRLESPLGMAAGFDKDAKLLVGLRSLGFGFVEIGSVTPKPQQGNPKPRLFRVPEANALINRMGFNSQGAQVVAERLRHVRAMYSLSFPVGVNLGKNRDTLLSNAHDDYTSGLEVLYPYADYFVVNLSSPNTPGLTQLQEADFLGPLLTQVRLKRDSLAGRFGSRPLLVKLSPDLGSAERKLAIETAMANGFEGVILSNTSRRRNFAGLEAVSDQILAQEGGISGAPLRETALAHLREARALVGPRVTLVSVGGLGALEDAKLRLEAGANLLQVYTEFVYSGPAYPRRMALGLASRSNS